MSKDLTLYKKPLFSFSPSTMGGNTKPMRRPDGSDFSSINNQRPDIRRARESSHQNHTPYEHQGGPPQYPGGPQQYISGPPHYPAGQQPYHGGPNHMHPQAYPHGGYYSSPPPSSTSSVASPLISHWRTFALNQNVQVNIQGHGWFIGTVVAILGAVQAITGSFIKVKYVRSGIRREDTFPNSPDHIRPF